MEGRRGKESAPARCPDARRCGLPEQAPLATRSLRRATVYGGRGTATTAHHNFSQTGICKISCVFLFSEVDCAGGGCDICVPKNVSERAVVPCSAGIISPVCAKTKMSVHKNNLGSNLKFPRGAARPSGSAPVPSFDVGSIPASMRAVAHRFHNASATQRQLAGRAVEGALLRCRGKG